METIHYSISWVSKALVLFILFASCSQDNTSNFEQSYSNLKVELENFFVQETVMEYAKEMHLDSNKVILSVNVKTTSTDTSVYINYLTNRDFKRYPTYYSVVGGYLVFIYTDVDQFLRRTLVQKEVESIIKEQAILLDSSVVINDSPTLKYSKCEGSVFKEIDADLVELPCYLKIIAEDGNLKLVRK